MGAMKQLGLILILCAAACGKKTPPPAPPAQPEPAKTDKDKPGEPAKPDSVNVPRTGDPCDGGQKPH
jgi:hypothetical protein